MSVEFTERNAEPDHFDPIVSGVRALHTMLLSDANLDETLLRVAELAAASLPMCSFADVTLLRDHRPVAQGETDARAAEFDAVHYASGGGPCLEAGQSSAMSVPLTVRGTVIGALNLYSNRERAFDDDDARVARLFAAQAAVALENARTYEAAVRLARQLQEALESRGPIEQAKGVLMARHHFSPDEAFELLVTRSQHDNRKLRLIAADVVAEAQHATEELDELWTGIHSAKELRDG